MSAEIAKAAGGSTVGGKYVPPSLRGGGDGKERRGETMNSRRQSIYLHFNIDSIDFRAHFYSLFYF